MTYTDHEILNSLTETQGTMDELEQRFQTEFARIASAAVGQQKRVLTAFGLYKIAQVMFQKLKSGELVASTAEAREAIDPEADRGPYSAASFRKSACELLEMSVGNITVSESSESVIESSFEEVRGRTLEFISLILKEVQFNLPVDVV